MSYGWEAKWIRRKFKMAEGIEIETCYDIVSNLILCPICVNISKVCPSVTEPSSTLVSNATYFFSPEDLFHHMRAHAKMTEWSRIYTVSEEEEEPEEEEELEEDLST
uniref:Uncharacterized protein n=1 Tax=Ignisphaera aggregans TaxID=334771 RepID=A0A7C5THF8_9CREN